MSIHFYDKAIVNHFRNLLSMYAKADIPTYSELILGLPEETYESFSDGICTLLENGQHKSINVYPCELLPNSQLGSPDYVETDRDEYSKMFIRLTSENFNYLESKFSEIFGDTANYVKNQFRNEICFISEPQYESELNKKLSQFENCKIKTLHIL